MNHKSYTLDINLVNNMNNTFHELYAAHCDTLQYTHHDTLRHPATPCNTLQHPATPCNTLQHPAIPCNTLQHPATPCNTLQHPATPCNTLQHSATHCNTDLPIAIIQNNNAL